MAVKGKKSESKRLSREETSREMVRRSIEKSAIRVGSPQRVGIVYISAAEREGYVQIVDSDGRVVEMSIEKVVKKINEELTKVVGSIGDLAQRTVETGKDIVKGASGLPFELDEVKVGLSIKVEAGLLVVGVGGDVNLELKFVRERTGAGKTL